MSPYKLQTITNGITNTNDLFRSYMDYIVGTDSLRDRNGSLLDYSKWLVQQLYVFKSRQPLESLSNSCTVSCEVKSANAQQATNIFILGLYDEWLTIAFDDEARYISYAVDSKE